MRPGSASANGSRQTCTWYRTEVITTAPPGGEAKRLGMLRHALRGLASPAMHGDDVAAQIRWDREHASAVIAGVAALAACRGQQAADNP